MSEEITFPYGENAKTEDKTEPETTKAGKVAEKALVAAENSKKTTEKKAKETIYTMIERQKQGFEMALPSNFRPERFTRLAITSIKNKPELQTCEPYSILGALMLAAQLGLEPNTPLHEASLIPYKGKATFQIEYRGLMKLVFNTDLVDSFDFDKICENDTFIYVKGDEPKFSHTPNLKNGRGEVYAYYAIAYLKSGKVAVSVMTKDEIILHSEKYSPAYNRKENRFSGPWEDAFDSMAYKTVIKQLCDKKLLKRSETEVINLAKAINMDESVVTYDESAKDVFSNYEEINNKTEDEN